MLEENQMLFKLLVVKGPHFLFNKTTANEFCVSYFLDKCAKQAIERARNSLWNPNFVHHPWSQDEERKLALSMKIHKDEISPLNMAAVSVLLSNVHKQVYFTIPLLHIFIPQHNTFIIYISLSCWLLYLSQAHFPHRAAIAISSKWNRALDSNYDTSAYTSDD